MSGRKSSGAAVAAETGATATMFASLVESLAGSDGAEVANGRGFGSGTLQVRGRIFAMASGGRLILKLPAVRVAELISSGEGVAFDAGRGRPNRAFGPAGDAESRARTRGPGIRGRRYR